MLTVVKISLHKYKIVTGNMWLASNTQAGVHHEGRERRGEGVKRTYAINLKKKFPMLDALLKIKWDVFAATWYLTVAAQLSYWAKVGFCPYALSAGHIQKHGRETRSSRSSSLHQVCD